MTRLTWESDHRSLLKNNISAVGGGGKAVLGTMPVGPPGYVLVAFTWPCFSWGKAGCNPTVAGWAHGLSGPLLLGSQNNGSSGIKQQKQHVILLWNLHIFSSQILGACDPQSFRTEKDEGSDNTSKDAMLYTLTDNGDHPDEDICETWDPHGGHEEGYHEPFLPEASPAVRGGQEEHSDDGQGQNPEDPFQVALWHIKHTPLLCWDTSRPACWWALHPSSHTGGGVGLKKTTKKNLVVPLKSSVSHLQESHWGHAGWGTGESILSHPGRCRCLFWSDCGRAGWCRHSSP